MKQRALAPLVLLALTAFASATTFHIEQVVGQGKFYADFSLVDGQFGGPTNSTVTIANIAVAGGSLGASLSDIGDVANVAGGFRLSDGPAYTGVRTTAFTTTGPTSILSFDITFASTADYAIEPDYFAYRLLDVNLDAAATTGFASEFLALQLGTGGSPTPLVFARTDTRSQFAGVGTPVVTIAPVPEPSMIVLGIATLGLLRRHRSRRMAPAGAENEVTLL